jgi:hypothetical protein
VIRIDISRPVIYNTHVEYFNYVTVDVEEDITGEVANALEERGGRSDDEEIGEDDDEEIGEEDNEEAGEGDEEEETEKEVPLPNIVGWETDDMRSEDQKRAHTLEVRLLGL